jgi:hypothetical protein
MATKEKRKGFGLEVRTFRGENDHKTYIVFRTTKGSYHVFKEVEAKGAALECGGPSTGDTRRMWGELWKSGSDAVL